MVLPTDTTIHSISFIFLLRCENKQFLVWASRMWRQKGIHPRMNLPKKVSRTSLPEDFGVQVVAQGRRKAGTVLYFQLHLCHFTCFLIFSSSSSYSCCIFEGRFVRFDGRKLDTFFLFLRLVGGCSIKWRLHAS